MGIADRARGLHRRAVLAHAALVPALAAPARAWPATQAADIVVTPGAANATGSTGPIAAALQRAAAAARPLTIGLAPGVYREKLTIGTPGVTLLGLGEGAVITYDAAAGLPRPDGGKWGTGGSATLTIEAPGVTVRGLTVRNDFDYIADTVTHASGGAQAVALSIGRGADRTLVERCAIEGYQDTLYVSTRALFRRCTIKGGVDFIFGGAAALFQHCDIVTRFVPGHAEAGFVTAPSTLASQRFGLVFDRCHLSRENDVPDRSTYLGRPWRAGGNMAILGAAAFLRCLMDAHIKPAGWTGMGFTDPAGTRRTLTPEEARLFEFASVGPGAGKAGLARRLLTAGEAAAYTPGNVLLGWTP